MFLKKKRRYALMKKMLVVLGVILVVGGAAFSQAATTGASVPNVKGIKAFSPAANFLSLPGLLRWQYFIDNGSWITPAEAERLVKEQLAN